MNSLLAYSDLWLIGGGGKTTLMFQLAATWAARGESVICTTTTRIWPPAATQCADVRIDALEPLLVDLQSRPPGLVTVASRLQDGKLYGFGPGQALLLGSTADHLIVEADGSAGRPVKAHASHEPVLSPAATCVVAVVGGWCVGAPLDADHVHRPQLFSALSGRPMGDTVTASDVVQVILGDQGWLRSVPLTSAFHVVITGTDSGIRRALESHPNGSRMTAVHAA